jgi:hypothetical protein
MDKTLNSIKEIINKFNKNLQTLLPPLEAEIKQLITNNVTDDNIIEHHLDTLLDLTNHGIAQDLFITLLAYYKNVNAEGAAFYWNEFDKDDAE